MSGDDAGVVVPADPGVRRSSLVLGRAVVADALRGVDAVGALRAEHEANWRRGYLVHFRRVLEVGLASRQAAVTIAADGLHAVHRRMHYRQSDGREVALDVMLHDRPGAALCTVEIRGTGAPEAGFSLPFRGERLSGDALARRLDSWAEAGALEPSAADRVRTVMAHPEWLRLDGQTVAVLGADAEMGPLPALLGWGARVAAVDLPRPEVWRRLLATGRDGAGTLLVPVDADLSAGADSTAIAAHAGLDLVTDLGAATEWLRSLPGRVVLGNYVYADGVTNLRVCAAVDSLTLSVQRDRSDLALAFLATPTDVFAVPPTQWRTRGVRMRTGPGRSGCSSCRCGRCPQDDCSDPSTSPTGNRASTTRSSRNRAPTTPWPNGCSAGGRPWPATPAASCPSTSHRPPEPARC